jgi:phage repressor protein C with HTH and peptisase S24 domain
MPALAKLMGYRGASGYQRYEDASLFKERFLSMRIARKLATALVGKGDPPIELADVMELAGFDLAPDGKLQGVEYEAIMGLGLEAADREFNRKSRSDVRPADDHQLIYPGTLPRDVPVFGVVVGGASGDFQMNGEIVDVVRRPPALVGKKGVQAFYVSNDSMSPMFKDGDLIYTRSGQPPAVGDGVVVVMKQTEDGEPKNCWLKEFVAWRGPSLIVRQYNPAMELPIPQAHIEAVLRVVPLKELMGV